MDEKKKIYGIRIFHVCAANFLIGTYDDAGRVNSPPITWVSITWNTDHYMLVISMFGSKRSKQNVEKSGVFSANLVSTDMLHFLDFFGSVSSKDGIKDKVDYDFSDGVALRVPALDIIKWVYECEVVSVTQTGDSKTFFCDIKNVQIDSDIDVSAGIDLTQFKPVVYSGLYHSIVEYLGKIGDFL